MIIVRLKSLVRSRTYYYGSYILNYIELQFFIMFCSWPIIAAWGLPLAPAGLLGNFLFGPMLTLFLFLSSLLFIAELFSLPHYPLRVLLEYSADFWTAILELANRSWLYKIAHPPLTVALVLPFLACFIMCFKPLYSAFMRISCFVFLFMSTGYFIPYLISLQNIVVQIPFGKEEITLMRLSNQTALIDQGSFSKSISSPKNIDFQLVPFLLKQGIMKLDHVILTRPSVRIFQTTARLLEVFPVIKLYVPVFKGNLSNKGWHSWQMLLTRAHQYKTEITSISCQRTLDFTTESLVLTVTPSLVKKNRLIYPLITVIKESSTGSMRVGTLST